MFSHGLAKRFPFGFAAIDGIQERLTARERAAEAEDSRRPLCSRAVAKSLGTSADHSLPKWPNDWSYDMIWIHDCEVT